MWIQNQPKGGNMKKSPAQRMQTCTKTGRRSVRLSQETAVSGTQAGDSPLVIFDIVRDACSMSADARSADPVAKRRKTILSELEQDQNPWPPVVPPPGPPPG